MGELVIWRRSTHSHLMRDVYRACLVEGECVKGFNASPRR